MTTASLLTASVPEAARLVPGETCVTGCVTAEPSTLTGSVVVPASAPCGVVRMTRVGCWAEADVQSARMTRSGSRCLPIGGLQPELHSHRPSGAGILRRGAAIDQHEM